MIKHRVAVDCYLQTGDAVAGAFIKKNLLKIIRDFIEHLQVERIQKNIGTDRFCNQEEY